MNYIFSLKFLSNVNWAVDRLRKKSLCQQAIQKSRWLSVVRFSLLYIEGTCQSRKFCKQVWNLGFYKLGMAFMSWVWILWAGYGFYELGMDFMSWVWILWAGYGFYESGMDFMNWVWNTRFQNYIHMYLGMFKTTFQAKLKMRNRRLYVAADPLNVCTIFVAF
jgi:hypothetical protein